MEQGDTRNKCMEIIPLGKKAQYCHIANCERWLCKYEYEMQVTFLIKQPQQHSYLYGLIDYLCGSIAHL